jgi:F-type H+-transporting ATPase subunit O
VCEKFGELMSAKRGEVEMTITSAERLDNKTLSRLEAAVSKSSYASQGKKLKVTNKVYSAFRKHDLRFGPNLTYLDTGRP